MLLITKQGEISFLSPLLLPPFLSAVHVVIYETLVYRTFSSIFTLYCIPSFALNNIYIFQYSFGQNTKTLSSFNKRRKLTQCELFS